MKSIAKQSSLGTTKIVPLTDEWFDAAKVSIDARLHLERSLRGLIKEQAPTPSFPLYGSRDSQSLITRFLDAVPWEQYDLPPGVKEYEYDRLKKVGPQGGHPAWKDVEPLFMLYQERLSPVSFLSARTIVECQNKYTSVYLDPIVPVDADLSLAQLLSHDKVMTTAAGCRDFNLKKTDPKAQDRAVHDIKTELFRKFRMYVFERYNKLKPRIFMPGPFSSMIDQASFIVPIMDRLQESLRSDLDSPLYHFADKVGFDTMFHDFFAHHMEFALKRLRRRLQRMGIRYDLTNVRVLYVQGDFEKMDTTTGTEQYRKIYIPITEVAIHSAYRSAYAESMLQTTTMPIISPSGVMVGNHGTGSGMENTNDGEKVCNLYYGTETKHRFDNYMTSNYPHIIYEFAGDYYNGDDSTFNILLYDVSDEDVDIITTSFQQAAETVAQECGFRINDKWRMDTHFGLYNQNLYWFKFQKDNTVSCTYMYPASLILNSIINPEHQYTKSTWDKDFRDLDVTTKLDNGRYLPYFHLLIDFVDNGMRYRLFRHEEKETYRILRKYRKYRALQSLSERYNRQDYDIKMSPTAKYVLDKIHRSHR
jgi:hypothetical protein